LAPFAAVVSVIFVLWDLSTVVFIAPKRGFQWYDFASFAITIIIIAYTAVCYKRWKRIAAMAARRHEIRRLEHADMV
jgi:hypothetical protein